MYEYVWTPVIIEVQSYGHEADYPDAGAIPDEVEISVNYRCRYCGTEYSRNGGGPLAAHDIQALPFAVRPTRLKRFRVSRIDIIWPRRYRASHRGRCQPKYIHCSTALDAATFARAVTSRTTAITQIPIERVAAKARDEQIGLASRHPEFRRRLLAPPRPCQTSLGCDIFEFAVSEVVVEAHLSVIGLPGGINREPLQGKSGRSSPS